jgi:tetratricopeptide (TPR) repeat protein
LKGVENARDPAIFYRLVVDIKSVGKATDNDMIAAMEYLQEHFPKQGEWVERLCDAYFQKGDVRRAVGVFEEATGDSMKGMRVRSLLVAAEAARLEGQDEKAISILETAYSVHPDTPSVLNNLVYCLARSGNDAKYLARARELLPQLMQVAGDSAFVLDTAAIVYMKSGNLEEARKCSARALQVLDRNEYAALEIQMNAAEILFRLGQNNDARLILEKIRRAPGRSHIVDEGTQDLLRRIGDAAGRK